VGELSLACLCSKFTLCRCSVGGRSLACSYFIHYRCSVGELSCSYFIDVVWEDVPLLAYAQTSCFVDAVWDHILLLAHTLYFTDAV